MHGNFSCFCYRLLTFFIINFFKKISHEHYQSAKPFRSRSGPTFVGPDLGPNCLQMLSADDKKSPLARKELMPFNDKTCNVFSLRLLALNQCGTAEEL